MAVDPRFYHRRQEMTERSIAKFLGIEKDGLSDAVITGLASFGKSRTGELCFVEDKKSLRDFNHHGSGLCLAHPSLLSELAKSDLRVLLTDHPRADFFKVASKLYPESPAPQSREQARIHATAHIEQGTIVQSGAVIGANTVIEAGSFIGAGVQIGVNCRIGPHTSVRYSLIGNAVSIYAGARLGETGFGLLATPSGAVDLPHFGRVIIQDNVTIGANSCIDRGLLEDTVIGEGTKIDNLSHIAHNCQIGRHVVMAAYAGIAGSVTIGDGVRMGGRCGVSDHLTVGMGAQLATGSFVLKDVPAGEIWGGHPARPLQRWKRELSWLKRNARRT